MDISAKGLNVKFPIYNADGSSFEDLVLHKSAFESVVMSLGDKITGDVYYKNNSLAVTMQEYIVYEGVKYVLVNPPTIVREGLVKDNSEAKGLTKYSFTFYHPMYMLGNFEFTDVAVEEGEERYLAQNKTFSWIGYLRDFVDKLNANLTHTQWIVSSNVSVEDDKLSEVLSFDNNFVSDALKTAYETWEKPFTIQQLLESDADYNNGKRFAIVFGMPDERVMVDGEEYTFRLGQGVGLKNNSRTPKNNKIVTRISGYGSENNIPWGYPQIVWTGDQTWDYTINNDKDNPLSYPIYNGIVNGQQVRLIKHPFTRNHLMPSIYSQTVFNKVSPYLSDGTANPNYNPQTPIIDYYDADGTFTNPCDPTAPSYEIHQFEDIKPELGNDTTLSADAEPYSKEIEQGVTMKADFETFMNGLIHSTTNEKEKHVLDGLLTIVLSESYVKANPKGGHDGTGGSYTYAYSWEYNSKDDCVSVKYESSEINFEKKVYYTAPTIPVQWDDTMDDDGNYAQSYFKLTLPELTFDIYACASITEEMKINMRSGACIGCTFPIMVDWDDYKKNFYDSEGNFDPYGDRRDYDKYPDSSQGSITVIVQKEYETFGTIMPNIYQQPKQGDIIVFLGISLPQSYIDDAEQRLDEASIEYMLENNVPLYEYPLKFDEYFLKNHLDILQQIHNNTRISFQFGGESPMALFVKQISIKWGENVLPQYDITLTDDIEVVLNQIGQVTEDVSSLRVQMSEIQKYYAQNLVNDISEKLSRIEDDIALGKITFQQGLEAVGSLILHSDIRSNNYVQGMTEQGRGWRIDELGNAEVESIRVRSFMEVMELLVNRVQAQEGDTIFSDNDQIDFVEEIEYDNTTYYRLTFKEKWAGYITSQVEGNILRGIANTLAAHFANVSDVTESQSVETDGANKYFTSWMRVVSSPSPTIEIGNNQVLVELYSDGNVPAEKNFAPCELMTVVRWGSILNPNEQGITQAEKERRMRLQRMFMLSNTDGRITKLVGVNSPILSSSNYGTTLGTLPQWVLDNYATVADRYQQGRDYLYAQGIVVEDFIKIDANHQIVIDYIDKGTWTIGQDYLVADPEQGILETHDVWYEGQGWRCKQSHTSNSNNYPQKDSAFWELLVKKGDDGTSFSSKGTAIGHYSNFTALEQDLPTIQPTENDLFILDTSNDYYESDGGEEHTGYDAPTVMRFINAPDFIWEAIEASEGDGYMVNNHLFVANESDWGDMGNIQGAKGDDGQSAFAVELDSNVDTIEANVGSTVRDYTKTIHIRAYYGNTNVLSACTITWATSDPDIEVSRSNDAITIEVADGTSFSPSNTITFTVAHPTYGNRTVVFSLNTVEQGDTVRQLQVYRASIGQPSAPSGNIIPPSGWSNTPPIMGRFENSDNSNYGGWRMARGNDLDKLFTRERVVFRNTGGSVTITIDGASSTEEDYDFLYIGKVDVDLYDRSRATSANLLDYYSGEDSGTKEVAIPRGTHYIDFAYSKDGSDSDNDDKVWYKISNTDGLTIERLTPTIWASVGTIINNVAQNDWSTPVQWGGSDGNQGKMGKNYYYGGVWDTSRQDTFTANDQETPYFVHNNNKWVYIGDNFSKYQISRIRSEKGDPQDNGNWQIMVTDFKYLISEAVFSNFASLGSFIISGDWMISQNGTVNGVASTDYNLFDPLHPNDNTGNNFIPAYAIDGLTGKAYINDAKVKGSIYANNGEFQGLMQNSMYSPWHSLADVQDKSYDNNFTTLNDQTYKIDSTIKNAGRILRFSSHDLLNNYGNRATLVLQGNDIDPQTGQPINTEYFYYHGIAVKQLYLNDEVVELLGLGTANKFLGWLVLDKKNVLNDKGLPLNVFVKAIVNDNGTIYTSSISDSRGLFSVERVSTGTYRITLPNALLSKRLTIVGGINSDEKRHVFFSSVKVTTINDLQHPYFIAETTDMSGNNVDCAFNFYVHDTSTL